MTDTKETPRVRAALPRGLVDRDAADIAGAEAMMAKIRAVYERYGFEAVETPFIEYTDALGKFLPDQDRPNEGVFSFQDDDEQWLSLRYDLTAPLARYVAEHYERLPKPYRSYRAGWVFRNEKPGPGRFRQFMQFDADTVGAASPAADAEICMMAADCLEALGIKRGDYVIKVWNRRALDGVMDVQEIPAEKRLTVLRAIDKRDRLGPEGMRALLAEGRTDESGDRTIGAGLAENQVAKVMTLFEELKAIDRDALEKLMVTNDLGGDENSDRRQAVHDAIDRLGRLEQLDPNKLRAELSTSRADETRKFANGAGLTNEQINVLLLLLFRRGPFIPETEYQGPNIEEEYCAPSYILGHRVNGVYSCDRLLEDWRGILKDSSIGRQGLDELAEINHLVRSAGYLSRRIRIDPSVVRGLEYYTGPVFEAELTFPVKDDAGREVRFGSVGGGGRYDGLIARFRGEAVPATGFSIGVSRLLAALRAIDSPIVASAKKPGPVVVAVLDRDHMVDYQRLTASLRGAGIAAEMYLGASGLNAQLKYADRRGSLCAIIQGSNEREAAGGRQVVIRDLKLGAELAKASKDRADYLELRQRAQFSAPEAELVARVREVLARSRS
jgi:histidyl-tRNA synthetase